MAITRKWYCGLLHDATVIMPLAAGKGAMQPAQCSPLALTRCTGDTDVSLITALWGGTAYFVDNREA